MFDVFSSIINILLFILHWLIGHYRHHGIMSGRKNLKRSLSFSGAKWQSVMKPGVSHPGSRSMGMLTTGRGAGRYSSRVPEIKFVDTARRNLTSASAATPPIADLLFCVVPGSAAYQRIGQRVQLKSLRIRGNIEGVTAYTGVDTGRILVVYDRQPNGAKALWTDVIASVTNAGATASTEVDGLNMANRERFQILADEQLYLNGFQSTAGVISTPSFFTSTEKNPPMLNFDRFIKLKNLEVHFNNGAAGTVADIQTGAVLMFFAAGANSDAKWVFEYGSRTRYQDI